MAHVPITFRSSGERLAGELLLPEHAGPHPAVLLIGGTLSDTRDGDPAPYYLGITYRHGLLRVIAEQLVAVGIASLRWDKRGIGASTGADRLDANDALTDVDDAEAALAALALAHGIDTARIAVLGESAGAHITSMLAARTELPAAYVLQGALYDAIPKMLEFNFERIRDYAARGEAEEKWVKQVAPKAFALSMHWRELVEAAGRGDEFYDAGEGETHVRSALRRLKSELAYPPADQLPYIQKPTLVIHGERDLNVSPDNAGRVTQALREAGNQNVTSVMVPRADHSMQLAPDDFETRLRERISFESFAHPYSQFFLFALAGWLWDTLENRA